MIIQIPYKPHQYQIQLHQSNARFKIVSGGRRVGKSLACLHEIIKHCIETPNACAIWVAPTHSDAREIGFNKILELEQDCLGSTAISKIHLSHMNVFFTNGSVLYFKGSDTESGIRGRGFTFAVMDEAAFCKPLVWSRIIRPALSDRKGRAILCSTPNGFNWFHNIWIGSKFEHYEWPTNLNPDITQEELDEVRSQIDQATYDQEYLAKFITKQGRVYSDFDDDNKVQAGSPDRTYEIYLGMDFGFANPTAIVFVAIDNATQEKVIQFDELYVTRTQIDEIDQLISYKLAEHGLSKKDIVCCYTDPAGNAEELSSGLSPVDSLRNLGYRIENKGSTINAGVALVRSYIKNSLGKRRFFVTENCKHTIRCFYGYQYGSDKNGGTKEEPLKDNEHDHLMDAVRYFFIGRFDKAKYVADLPDTSSYTMSSKQSRIFKRCNKCGRPFISTTPVNTPPLVCSSCS